MNIPNACTHAYASRKTSIYSLEAFDLKLNVWKFTVTRMLYVAWYIDQLINFVIV